MKDSCLKRILLKLYYSVLDVGYAIERKYTQYYIKYHPVVKNKIIFCNFFGNGYGDNPKYIAEEIHRQNLNWDMVWLVKDRSISIPSYLRPVIYGSEAAKRELSTANVVVNNIRNSMYLGKKTGQIFLQTWHGGIGFKKVEGAAEANLNPGYVYCAKRDGNECDAIISACASQSEEFRHYFWLNPRTEILEVGQPRCDALFVKNSDCIEQKVRSQLNIPNNIGIILYAPTFRDDGSVDCYALDFDKILDAFEQKFNRKYVFIVRLHPNAQELCSFLEYNSKIMNGSVYPDIQELYHASDVLITDYSSAAMDFALLNKPVFMCALDYKKYLGLRGVNDFYHMCPFPRSFSTEELIESIMSYSEDEYMQEFTNFKDNIWKPFDDGHAAQRTVAWLQAKLS